MMSELPRNPRRRKLPENAGLPEGEPKLTRRQEAAIAALLSHPTIEAAAKAAGVGERTLRGWMHDRPEFRREYARRRAEVLEGVLNELQAAGAEAVATLRAIAGDTTAAKPARVAAAGKLLDLLLRAKEVAAEIEAEPGEDAFMRTIRIRPIEWPPGAIPTEPGQEIPRAIERDQGETPDEGHSPTEQPS